MTDDPTPVEGVLESITVGRDWIGLVIAAVQAIALILIAIGVLVD